MNSNHTIILTNWVCSKFLRVNRSINEIDNPRALYSINVFYKKVCIYLFLIFSCKQLIYKIHQILKNAYLKETAFF
jgi:hypothetical protein